MSKIINVIKVITYKLDNYLFCPKINKYILMKNNVIFNFDTCEYNIISDNNLHLNQKHLSVDFKLNFLSIVDDKINIHLYLDIFKILFTTHKDIYLNTTINTYNIITNNLRKILNNHYLYDTLYPFCVYNMEIFLYCNRKISSSDEYLNKEYCKIDINFINLDELSVDDMELIFSIFITQLLHKKSSDIYVLMNILYNQNKLSK